MRATVVSPAIHAKTLNRRHIHQPVGVLGAAAGSRVHASPGEENAAFGLSRYCAQGPPEEFAGRWRCQLA